MRIAAILVLLASPAAAERIFPSLPDEYRSGTVELQLAGNRADDGGGYGGINSSPNRGSDGFATGASAISMSRSEWERQFRGQSSGGGIMGTSGHGAAVGGTMGGIGPCGCH
jgi:hypothetical protein